MRKKQLEGKFFEIPRCRNCEMATNGDEGILHNLKNMDQHYNFK